MPRSTHCTGTAATRPRVCCCGAPCRVCRDLARTVIGRAGTTPSPASPPVSTAGELVSSCQVQGSSRGVAEAFEALFEAVEEYLQAGLEQLVGVDRRQVRGDPGEVAALRGALPGDLLALRDARGLGFDAHFFADDADH